MSSSIGSFRRVSRSCRSHRRVGELVLLASTALLLLLSCQGGAAFAPVPVKRPWLTKGTASASISANDMLQQNYVLTREEVNPLIKLGEGAKEKVVNAFGFRALAISLLTGPAWILAMSVVDTICKMNEAFDPNREIYDRTGKVWARIWLTLTDSFPTFSGEIEHLRTSQGPCLYVANHASWLDIPVLCTVLDPVFKFIAKAELEKVPCIGQQLKGGNHILIDRTDRRSQLRTFKEGVGWLKKGVPLMAFPEGMRSPDGRLMEFKGGIFSMALKTGVPVVPISLSHTHAIMPGNALFPVQPGKGKLHVHVHKAIESKGKTDEELQELVKESLLSQLPEYQHPLVPVVLEEAAEEEIVEEQPAEIAV